MDSKRNEHKSAWSHLLPTTWAGRCGAASIIWGLLMIVGWVLNAHWESKPPENRPIQVPTETHVTAESCSSCHPGNYASWHASYHRTMTQVAKPENFAAEMDGLMLSRDGTDYRFEKGSRSYFVRTKKTGADDSTYGPAREVVMLTGSHTLQLMWLATEAGRTLEQFPFGYIIAEKKWAPMVQTFLVPPHQHQSYSRGDWNDGCIYCHTTVGRSLPSGDGVFDSQVNDFGIACAACHGPGEEHIKFHQNPANRYLHHWAGGADPTIANPARMDGLSSTMVCGQCHSIWDFNNPADSATADRLGNMFEPGDKALKLGTIPLPYSASPEEREKILAVHGHSFWGDGRIRVTGREYQGTVESPCFKGGQFSCISCHEMHPKNADSTTLRRWANQQLTDGMRGDQACMQCHQDMASRIPAHTNHALGSSGSSCYNCHMPHNSYGLLRAIRTHQISIPTVDESLTYGRPNACNLCHLDQPLGWTAQKLSEWYGQPIPQMTAEDREIAAGAKWLVKGDAGQRALVAWSMGWEPAQRASGYEWFYPFLIMELNDPYAAVRFTAWKALQSLPGFADFEYDYTTNDAGQKAAADRAYAQWYQIKHTPRGGYRWQTLLQPDGQFRSEALNRMLKERDNRNVYLLE